MKPWKWSKSVRRWTYTPFAPQMKRDHVNTHHIPKWKYMIGKPKDKLLVCFDFDLFRSHLNLFHSLKPLKPLSTVLLFFWVSIGPGTEFRILGFSPSNYACNQRWHAIAWMVR